MLPSYAEGGRRLTARRGWKEEAFKSALGHLSDGRSTQLPEVWRGTTSPRSPSPTQPATRRWYVILWQTVCSLTATGYRGLGRGMAEVTWRDCG